MTGKSGGPIAWMAQNSVASNLLMCLIFVAGILGLRDIEQEVFPNFQMEIIQIGVSYPGSSPEEVEQGVLLAVEEQVSGLDGVKRVTSSAQEGAGQVSVELLLEANPEKMLTDIQGAVDRIRTLPEELERPTVSLQQGMDEVVRLVIAAELPLSQMELLAEQARQELLQHPDISQVTVSGLPPNEIAVEIPRERLDAMGLTLEQVARQVREGSVDVPGGSLKTPSGEVLTRVHERRVRGADYESLEILSGLGGARVQLGELGAVRDAYEEQEDRSYYNGKRALLLTAYRVGDETPMRVSDGVREVRSSLQARMPPEVELALWDDDSESLRGRIDLLVRNARAGLILVLLILAMFLEIRLAFWVALGIPISFMGAFALMPGMELSVNMVSLFALIVTLGMVVDDAIVVGESAYTRLQQGEDPMQAAISGARQMAVPVTFAVLTTIAAFAPLLAVPGFTGKIFRVVPLVVLAVLIFSLVESFFILPAHLAHLARTAPPWTRPFERVRGVCSGALQRFTQGPYRRLLGGALDRQGLTLSLSLSAFMLSLGLLSGRVVPFNFFPQLEGDIVTASARFPFGTPVERTERLRETLERSAVQAAAELGEEGLLVGMYTRLGSQGGGRGSLAEQGGHLLEIQLQLKEGELRETSSSELAQRWKQLTEQPPGLESLRFSSASGPGASSALTVQLSHPDVELLGRASRSLREVLLGYSDLTNVENSFASGKPRLDLELLPAAQRLGVSAMELGRQLRAAFFGVEILREQRGRKELVVRARLPSEQRSRIEDLRSLPVRTAQGGHVPLKSLAELTESRAPTSIQREDGRRVVEVSADLIPGVASVQSVSEALEADVLPQLRAQFPGLSAQRVGRERSREESLSSLSDNYLVALLAIYGLLAVPFRSYIQPLIVMSAIPLGFVGAILGHLVMGYPLSIISIFGIIALSGVVVNDSLVLIDAANQARSEGLSPREAIQRAGERRLRPIVLTSLTTFFGLAPMIFESSVQARFLIPMALSLGFGVLAATGVVLLVVPALYLRLETWRDKGAW